MPDADRYAEVVFPEYYHDIFAEEDLEFRLRLIRNHLHPKLRLLLTGCLEEVSSVLETDPYTFSRVVKDPQPRNGIDQERLRCALYGLRPNEVHGKGYPNLRSGSGRGRHMADFDLSFFADREGLGLELHVGRPEELVLLEEVYAAHRDRVDALLTFVRLGVDGPAESRLLSLGDMIRAAKESEGWIAIFEPRYPFPIVARDFMARFEDCFLALYLIYDAMLSRALGIEDHFDEQFERLEQHYRTSAQIDDDDEYGARLD